MTRLIDTLLGARAGARGTPATVENTATPSPERL
jgi:hypothetical protein